MEASIAANRNDFTSTMAQKVLSDAAEKEKAASVEEDMKLMKGMQAQDPTALERMYDKYAPVVKSLALRVVNNEAEAEDLVQEIFMEIWTQSGNFAPEKGKPLGWMLTLARRRSIDRLRKRQAYQRAEDRLQQETEQQPEAWTHVTADEDVEMADVRELLRKVLSHLPDAQRQAVELAYYQGMSQREIAAATGIPLGTIKTRLELGLKKISEALKGMRDEF